MGFLVEAVLGDAFVEAAGGAKEAVEQVARGALPCPALHLLDHGTLGEGKQRFVIEGFAEEAEGALQHGGGGADGVVPVDFAEHDIAGEDHHLGGGFSFFGDGESVAGGVEAETLDQTGLIKIAAVRDAGVEAVAHEIVHLVDVDGA